MKFAIGDKVRVKDFSELAKKFPIYKGGIKIGNDYLFERAMKVYCGEIYIISDSVGDLYELGTADYENWAFHQEVLEKADITAGLLSDELSNAKIKIQALEEEVKQLKSKQEEKAEKEEITFTKRTYRKKNG